ncbi:unnamed protein product [Clavelina lepadiformis]|uniref:Dynactin subunit 6 n=1 Tax=Clavelina lepadiformis TaxID=159417 RepID=A0ABP0FRV3_CLALP
MLMQRRKNENTTATIAADAVVCEEATLEGSITIGPRCIVHPKATIIAKDGPIVIGESNLIEEQTKIINRNLPGTEGNSPLIIGDNNLFEVGSEFEGKFIGSNNVLEAKAKVGPLTTLSNGCTVGSSVHLNAAERLPDNTVICGKDYLRQHARDKPAHQGQQLDFLKKILPNYHFLIKSKKHA